jgi:ATP-binding cassette subfamily D (ALD) protein 3
MYAVLIRVCSCLVIKFNHVNVITPTGDLLVKDLSLIIESGQSCLISGPNGSGKSSLFRLLGGLWPLFGGGEVVRPASKDLFYVPQRPYLPLGNLREQLLYPLSEQEFHAQGRDDSELLQLLRTVHLEYLIDRAGAFDAIRDWQDVLSGGEKQRIAMARLFLHRPRFAILDECTSAVSIDVEARLYEHAQNELKMTLFTISHRPSLDRFHAFRLAFDGQGGYSFGPCDVARALSDLPEKESESVKVPKRRMSTTAMEVEEFSVGSVDVPRQGTPQFLYSYPQRSSNNKD